MADGGFDPRTVTSALPALMSLFSSGMTPRGSDDYDPRNSVFANDVPNYFTMGQTLSQLGGSGLLAGTGMDTMLRALAPELTNRMRAQSGMDPMQMAQSREAMQAIMQTQFMGTGRAIAESLHMDPNSAAGQTLGLMAPMLIQAMPELAGLAYSMAPTAMFTGGKNIVAALQMLDPMSQIRPGEASAMFESMRRLGTRNGFMNTEFTHGENMDEFAQAIEFTADMRINAQGLDIEDMRNKTRSRLKSERFGSRETLTDAETEALDADTTKVVAKDRRTIAASMNAEVAQAVKSALGGTTSDAFNFMKENNLTAQTAGQADSIAELVRNLDALGKQAGVTMKDMMNAGRIISAQSGGDALYNAQAYGLTASVGRRLDEFNLAQGRVVDPSGQRVQDDELNQSRAELNRSPAMMAMTAMYTTSARARAIIDSGNAAGTDQLIKEFYADNTAEAKEAVARSQSMPAEEEAEIQGKMNRLNTGKGGLPALAAQAARRYAVAHLGKVDQSFIDVLNNEDDMRIWGAGQRADRNTDEILADMHITGQRATEFLAQVAGTSQGQNALRFGVMAVDADKAADDVQFQARSAGLVAEMSNLTAGMEGPLIKNILAGKVTDVSSALSAWGKLIPKDLAKAQATLANMTPAQQKDFVSAMQQEQTAVRGIIDAGMTSDQEAKQKAEDSLLDAENRLHRYGFQSEKRGHDGTTIDAWADEAQKRANAADQKDSAGGAADPVVPPSTSGATPKTGDKTSSNEKPATVNGEICIRIIDQRGSDIPDGQWTLSAIKQPGSVDMIKGKALG